MVRTRYTKTSRYFSEAKPVETDFDLRPVRRRNRRPIVRLGFDQVPSPKVPWSCPGLAHIVGRLSDPAFMVFPDTGFITTAMDAQVWDALCLRTVVLVPPIAQEIQGWLQRPYQNQWLADVIHKAFENRDNPLTPQVLRFRRTSREYLDRLDWQPYCFTFPPPDYFGQYGFEHYRDLLLVRKLIGRKVADEMRATLGREPTEQELRKELRPLVGERGEQLAIKGWKDYGKRNYAADEELVVMAVITAITLGRETLILTWDTDLQEQFVKLLITITSDYYACLIAHNIASNQHPPLFKMPMSEHDKRDLHLDDDVAEYVVISEADVLGIRPQNFHPVTCSCYVLGNHRHDLKATFTEFCAEQEMACVLEVKAQTGGRNTDRFGTRNARLGTYFGTERHSTLFMLANDAYIDFMGLRVRGLDKLLILRTQELVKRILF